MVLVMVIAVMAGAEQELRARVLSLQPHLLLARIDGPMPMWPELRDRLQRDPAIARVAPTAYGQGVARSATGVAGIFIKGFDATSIPPVLAGTSARNHTPLQPDGDQPILPRLFLGRSLATELKVSPGDTISLALVGGRTVGAGIGLPAMHRFVVEALFDSGMREYDRSLVFARLPHVQQLTGLGDAVSGLELFVHDIFAADALATRLGQELGHAYWCRSWMQMNRNLFTSLRQQKAMMFIILILIILVAAFNIASALIMMVTQKRRDIAILKAMGASSGSIARIFAIKGMIIGGIGTTAGMLLGVVGCQLLRRYHFVDLPPDVYFFTTLPVSLQAADVARIVGSALLLCLMASLYPAWRASRLDPVAILRLG
jgi:lipoprotein-releasing system permease protein